MTTTLTQAPVGVPLIVSHISGGAFAERMSRLGLYQGAGLTRLNAGVAVEPVKIRGVKGDAILSGWLAGQVVIHLDDGRLLPLPECSPHDKGHVEGITGRTEVETALHELGIVENDYIEMVRRMPPMRYTFSVNGRGSFQMDESTAAHLLGITPGGQIQFSSVGLGEVFTVSSILPGGGAQSALASLNIKEGSILVLTSVAISQPLAFSRDHPVACVTKPGLRLYFREEDAGNIHVDFEASTQDH